MNQILFYAGLAVMGVSTVSAVVSLVVFHMTGRRLKRKLRAEYGDKRR